ncbi:uncharacterized protein LOC128198191 [Bicyclus anynana]|uniref:Uncharacterized protein LOC128198191 n=1 Tax=Bicyclus anynana TaxID=110368 RepID=A0ABM3LGG5_BICAN|nr:uncharacterized protein LOC128198191 [Bicyclus anynana]
MSAAKDSAPLATTSGNLRQPAAAARMVGGSAHSISSQRIVSSTPPTFTRAHYNSKINNNSYTKPPAHSSNVIRALIDQGSQATLITESCVQRLGLQRFRTSTSATVTGIGDKDNQPRGYVMCEITPYNKSEPKLYIEALILPKITSYVPTIPSSFETITHLQNLPLADPELRSSRPIELLLGSDYTDRILLHNIIKGPLGTPVAINSIFGFLLNGRISSTFSSQVCVNVSTYQLDMQIQKFWESESVLETQPLTKDEVLCESIYQNTYSRDSTGKYTVSLPFKENAPPLGDSRGIALSRLHRLESKLSNNHALRADYIKCLQEYIDLGHMELVRNPSTANCYYIPHFSIVKQSSTTTKVRIVYDASCKTTSGHSLNDNLLIGPKLQQDIVQVLLKYRLHNIVFTSDIKMMYRYIQIRNEDRDFQRILWRNSVDDPIQEYRLCTVTFGVASAPFLALRTLRQLALDESSVFPLASQVLLNDVFVDDVVTGAATLEDALKLQRELTGLCRAGTFELRKWTSNNSEFLSSISKEDLNQDDALILSSIDDDNSVKILGLQWNPKTDTFSYHVNIPSPKCTKRIMLSEISKIYDPLGFVSPITLLVKHLIQLLWISGVGWDEQPPQSIYLQTNEERRKHTLVSQKEPQDLDFLEKISSLSKLLRVVSMKFVPTSPHTLSAVSCQLSLVRQEPSSSSNAQRGKSAFFIVSLHSK